MLRKGLLRKAALAGAITIAAAVAAPGHAETTTVTAPFTRGQMCYKYPAPGSMPAYGWFCHNAPAPYGYVPNQWDTAAPFNAIAETARNGELVVGGWERLGTAYLVNAYRAASIVEFDGPAATSSISATADITGVNVSSPTVNTFKVCLRIYDLGPIGGYGAMTEIGRDCFNKTASFRTLSATGSVGANREVRVEVSLDNTGENGGARATVANISYTLP